MNKSLHLLFSALLVAVIISAYAQNGSSTHQLKVLKDRTGIHKTLEGVHSQSDHGLSFRLPDLPSIQSTNYIPLNEMDSFYDVPSSTWHYGEDLAHTYYLWNCRDSVVTHTKHGVNTLRETLNYDQQNYYTYDLIEIWNGSNWVDSELYLSPALPNTCYYQYNYYLNWNGTNWDTTDYSRRTTVANFDSYNNPTYLLRQKYQNNSWVNYFTYSFSYNASHQLIGRDYAKWDTTLTQFVPQWRDTNLTYSSYTNLCNYTQSTLEQQAWNGTTWQNNYKSIIVGDTTYGFSWNGSSYDSLDISILSYDSYGNELKNVDYTYDSVSHSWIVIAGYDQYLYTYGIHNEVTRLEEINDYYYGGDSILPFRSVNYSNFIPCTAIQDVNELQHASSIKVYPNPAWDKLYIDISANDFSKNLFLSIFNSLGETIKEVPLNSPSSTIVLKNMPSGIYFYRLLSEGSPFKSGKVMIE